MNAPIRKEENPYDLLPPTHKEVVDAIELVHQKIAAGTLQGDAATFGKMLIRVTDWVFRLRAEKGALKDERDQARTDFAVKQVEFAEQEARHSSDQKATQQATRSMMVVADTRATKIDGLHALMREVLAAGGIPKPLAKKIRKTLDEQA